ncbi:MAG: HNH endonuclease [Rhodothermales bacterium]
MEDVSGVVRLTSLGRALASGSVSRKEFAAHVVATYRLPNPLNPADVRLWNSVGLSIHPFRVILDTVKSLRQQGASLSFITRDELIKILIPAAGQQWDVNDIAKAIRLYRDGTLDTTTWPDVTPGANDHRFAKEYLLFLAHYGYLHQSGNQFFLLDEVRGGIEDILRLLDQDATIDESVEALHATGESLFTDQARGTRSTTSKDRDPRFRMNVIDLCNSECVISTVGILDVLEAAHIIPVEYDGSDDPSNGLLLRRDYHRLFDKGLLRIFPDGRVEVASRLTSSQYYSSHIPAHIRVPNGVAQDALQWRLQHL